MFAPALRDLASAGRVQPSGAGGSIGLDVGSLDARVSALERKGVAGFARGTLTYLASDSAGRTYAPTIVERYGQYFPELGQNLAAYPGELGLYQAIFDLTNFSAAGHVLVGLLYNDANVVRSATVDVTAGDQPEGLPAAFNFIHSVVGASVKLESYNSGGGTVELEMSLVRLG